MLECCSVNQAMFRSSRKILDGSFGLRSTFGLIFLTPAPFPAQNLTPKSFDTIPVMWVDVFHFLTPKSVDTIPVMWVDVCHFFDTKKF